VYSLSVIEMDKGKLEAIISNKMIAFQREQLGRGAESAKTYILDDMVIIRLKGVLTAAEKQLAKDAKKSGREAKKAKKEAYKRYWNAQSKEARKSVERNARNQKKRTRKMKRRN
jgi:uncharacterized protein YbcI